MKLLLALSVILVTFCVLTESKPSESQSDSKSLRDHIETAGNAIKDFGVKVAEKVKTFFKYLHNSEAMTKMRNWFTETFKKIKTAFSSSG